MKRKVNSAKISYRLLVTAVIIAGVFTSSCDNKNVSNAQYYAIDSLIKAQVFNLSISNATLTKRSQLGNKTDTTLITLRDTTRWAVELDVFRQLAEINKPINKGTYIVHDAHDSHSNLSVKSFTGTEDYAVEYLKLYYQSTPSNLKKLEAQYSEENILYKSTRILNMEFNNIGNKIIVTSYSVNGGQKMFLGDSITYSIEGEIKIK